MKSIELKDSVVMDIDYRGFECISIGLYSML